jgi:hypothetical protein
MRLVDKLKNDGVVVNITGNSGIHYNSVRIVETYDDFVVVEPATGVEKAGGAFRGENANINIVTITRLEEAGLEQRIRAQVKGR